MIKRFGCALLLIAAFTFVGHAVPLACASTTLHSYDAAGFSCTEGNETFSNFSFLDSGTDLPLPTDSSINVSPLSDGFAFDAGFFVPSGETLDVTLAYTVTISAGTLVGDSLAIGGFGQSGNGSLDVAESLCVGAAFNSSGVCVPPATTASLNVFDNSSGFQQSASDTFSATTVGVIKDIAVSGGTGSSSAQLSLVDNVTPFAAPPPPPVPEPSVLSLIGVGLVGIGCFKKRRLS